MYLIRSLSSDLSQYIKRKMPADRIVQHGKQTSLKIHFAHVWEVQEALLSAGFERGKDKDWTIE